ncbi:MAG: hypothetical protein DYG94_06915 [Leptolyngbya sp. PLA3]|nr:MAG: hypothetical protein EDM82_06260 [Cyanobacteria bacterium CYA]MCE7968459.1 hypothetical protein [Leptolyngbya sp. PL-A3]
MRRPLPLSKRNKTHPYPRPQPRRRPKPWMQPGVRCSNIKQSPESGEGNSPARSCSALLCSRMAARSARYSADALQTHCRSLVGVTEDIKWGDNLIFSVGGKMFAGFDTDGTRQFAFKCDDDDFDRLTEIDGIIPAPYSARFGWVKVMRRDALPPAQAKALLTRAHAVVAAGLSRKKRAELGLE